MLTAIKFGLTTVKASLQNNSACLETLLFLATDLVLKRFGLKMAASGRKWHDFALICCLLKRSFHNKLSI